MSHSYPILLRVPVLTLRVIRGAILLLLVMLAAGCSNDRIWGRTLDELDDSIAHDPHSLLESVSHDDLGEIARRGPEWPMVMALTARSFDRHDLIDGLLESGVGATNGAYQTMYRVALAQHRIEAERFEEAEPVAKALFDSDTADPEFARLYLLSLYWQQRDQEASEILSHVRSLDLTELSTFERQELDLIEAAIATRLNQSDARQRVISLYTGMPVSEIHYRAYAFLTRRSGGFDGYSEFDRALMHSYALAADDRNQEATRLLEAGVLTEPDRLTAPMISTISDIYRASGRSLEGYSAILRLIDTTQHRRVALFESGRLARDARLYGNALDLFEQSLTADPTANSYQLERIRWYVIDTARIISANRATEAVSKHRDGINRPWYFDDAFEALITDIARERAWALASRVGNVVANKASTYIRGLFSFFTMAIESAGLGDATESLSTFATTSGRTAGARYVRYLAAGELRPWNLLEEPAVSDEPDSGDSSADHPETEVLRTLLDLTRYPTAYDWISSGARSDGFELLDVERAALEVSRAGLFTQGMRLADRVLRDVDYPISVEVVKASFPLAFDDIVRGAAERAGVPASLAFALLREESYFDPEATSAAGAIGLSQLMPATAEDMAGRLDMRAYDLRRPSDNITIGIEYLAYCIRYFDSTFLGVIAYNAGLGRIRSWLREYRGLPKALLVSTLPFAETRHFYRKVLTSTLMYEYLYPDLFGSIETSSDFSILWPSIGGES